jgi:hypothetical protein
VTADAFEGWAIVELMGYRRLAGYVRQAEQFGVAMLRLDVPEHPWVDGCTCGSEHPDSLDPDHHNHACHAFRAEDDTEIKDVHATQFYGGSSIYCLTPTTEEAARAVATRARPTPVQSWELPRRELPAVQYVPDDGEGGPSEDEEGLF